MALAVHPRDMSLRRRRAGRSLLIDENQVYTVRIVQIRRMAGVVPGGNRRSGRHGVHARADTLPDDADRRWRKVLQRYFYLYPDGLTFSSLLMPPPPRFLRT